MGGSSAHSSFFAENRWNRLFAIFDVCLALLTKKYKKQKGAAATPIPHFELNTVGMVCRLFCYF